MRKISNLMLAAAALMPLTTAARAQPAPAAPPTVILTLPEVDGLMAVLGEAPAKLSAQALLFLASKRQQATAAPASRPEEERR